jgi:peptidoglycan/xylan/chitin deacetylase (PgdA/CDA1 family)
MWIGIGLLSAGAAYTLGAQLLTRLGAAVRQGPPQSRVALTFDDGPHPLYTPHLLELLEAHQVRATFFLIGRHAEAHPQIVRTIAVRHDLGSHTYSHPHLWRLSPWQTHREILEGHRTVEAIAGRPVRFFRPPWGAMSLPALWTCRTAGIVPVLWTVRGEGAVWRPSAEEMAQEVVRRSHPGAIVNLHDRGGFPDTPERVLRALPAMIRGLRARGLEPVGLEELLGGG